MRKTENMSRKSKLIVLFFCGFVAGICLEIILIERQKGTSASFFEEEVINPPCAWWHPEEPQIIIEPFKKRIFDSLVYVSNSLQESVNISCLVLIKHQHMRYVNSSMKTWLKHCTNYNLVSVRRLSNSFENTSSKPSRKPLDVAEFHSIIKNYSLCSETEVVQEIFAKNAWAGLCKALHLKKPDHFEWLVIIPDSLMVVVENLKLFVTSLDCDDNHYYGYALKNYEADYNVLSAGILLSRGSVKKLLEKFKTQEDCNVSGKYWRNEDLYLGKYLKQLNIFPKDSRDEEGRGRFHGYNMNNVLWPGKLFLRSDYNRKALYPVSQGYNCCSPFLITVDVSDPDSMHNLYFLMYKLKTVHNKIPKKVKINKTEGTYWKSFLREEGYSEAQIENMTNEEYYKIWEKRLPQNKMYEEMRNFIQNNKENFD